MKKLILILAIAFLYGCSQSQIFTQDKMLTDFLDIDAIEKAEVHNNNGTFLLNKKQLENLKKALKKLQHEPNQDIKAGAKAVVITIDNKEYLLTTITNGNMADISINNDDFVFKTNGLNLDNYEKN